MRRVVNFLCVALLVQLTSCAAKDVTKQVTPKSIKVESARAYTDGLSTNFVGKIVANDEIRFAFRVAGTIADIPVILGQSMREGDVVATLDSRDYKTQLLATEAEYRQIDAEAQRVIELYNRKSVPKNDYDKAVSALERITAKLTSHRDALADCTLKAPMDGQIQKIIFNKGETVGAGMPVISMISSRDFEVEIFVSSAFYSKMEGNHSCSISQPVNSTYDLKFVSIAPKANANGLYAVRFKVVNTSGSKLVAGASCSVTINNSLGDSTLVTIPLLSLFEKSGESYIWIYDDQTNRVRSSKVDIVKLLNSGDMVVSEGVLSGDQVVTAGVYSIDETMAVKSLPAVSTTNVGGLK